MLSRPSEMGGEGLRRGEQVSDICSHPRRYKKGPCKRHRTVQLLPGIPGSASSSGKGWAARAALAPRDAGGAVRGNPRLINKVLLQMQIGIMLDFFFFFIL